MIKYFLVLSALLNSALLMHVTGVLPFLLYVSTVINIVLIWYVSRLVNQQGELREDNLEMLKSIESFSDHLDSLHGLETFYGDQKLQDLIQHSRELINEIITLQEKYYDDLEVEQETYDDNTEEKTHEEDE